MNRNQIMEKVQYVWSVEASSIESLKSSISSDAIESVLKAIAECKVSGGRIVTTGCGTSAAAARKIAHSLSCVEVPSFFLSPADAVHGALGALQKSDVMIAVSKGGNTEEIMKLVPSVLSKGAKLVGVTENENSKLASSSDILLKIKVDKEPDQFNMLATASTMAVIAVFDAIAIALMDYTGYTREQFAVIHPGGAVGERLLKGDK